MKKMIEKIRYWFDRKFGLFHKPKSIDEMTDYEYEIFWVNHMGFPYNKEKRGL
jgi:hypothetical protein